MRGYGPELAVTGFELDHAPAEQGQVRAIDPTDCDSRGTMALHFTGDSETRLYNSSAHNRAFHLPTHSTRSG
jgi:hypothetical protein